MIGQIIGNYKIERKLGEGGMGAVYQGVDTMLDREVAIKALRPELASQTAIVERFRSEAVTLAKLHHPNIATLYSLFRQGNELYMVLEFVRGETLDTILQRRGVLPTEEVIPVFCQILDGINHAHEFGIIHRDIKPANMMLTEKGTLKVLDFGIARLLGSARMTRAGNIIGTLEYMAPEQVKGEETDARSDIYALGMMLYEMLTGRTAFESDNEFELMKLQTEVVPAGPRVFNPSIPEVVEQAIMKSIQKDPDARFQTAGEFRQALLEAGFDEQGAMRRTITGNRLSQILSEQSLQIPASQLEASQPPLTENSLRENHSDEKAIPPASSGEIKETRFVAPSHTPVEALKETRFSPVVTSSDSAEPKKSFLSSLTWIHYAGAGFAAVIFLGLLAIIPILLLSGGGFNSQPVKSPEVKTPDKPPVVVSNNSETQQPEVVNSPEKPQTVSQSSSTDNNLPPSTNGTPINNNPQQPVTSQLPDPVDKQPSKPNQNPDKPAPKQDAPPKQRETVAQKPPPQRSAPPAKVAEKPSGEREKRLERLLTDH